MHADDIWKKNYSIQGDLLSTVRSSIDFSTHTTENSMVMNMKLLRTIIFLLILEVIFQVIDLRGTSMHGRASTSVSITQANLDSQPKMRFDPQLGHVYLPHCALRFRNKFDYNQISTTNALGFLDREHDVAKKPGVLRILILGDSFVEAGQVPIADKFQVLLETKLNRALSPRTVETIAMGIATLGTASELEFYKALGRPYQPNLVALVFSPDDFANNSALLEALRNGFSPDHLPRVTYRKQLAGGFVKQPVDPAWKQYAIAAPQAEDWLSGKHAAHLLHWLQYSAAFRHLAVNFFQLAQHERYAENLADRIALLAKNTEYAPKLEGWLYPDDLGLDAMFSAADMPPAFEEAVEITAHILGLLKMATMLDNAHLLVVAVDGCSFNPNMQGSRKIVNHGCAQRLQAITGRLQIPMLDLGPALGSKGALASAHWPNDAHWNQRGHVWVASVIYEYLMKNRALLANAVPAK